MSEEFRTLREWKNMAQSGERPSGNLRKQLSTETRGIDLDKLTVDFVISTAARDREGDTISIGGWETANYMRNPVVLWAHDHSLPPVGQALQLSLTENELRATTKFTPRDISPFGYMVFQMYTERFLRATSVGFVPLEWAIRQDDEGFGIDFTRQELLEFSCVPVPANPEALSLARSKGIDLAPLRDWAEATLDAWPERRGEVALPRGKVEDLRKQVISVIGPVTLSLADQVRIGKENLSRIRKPDTATDTPEPVVLEVDAEEITKSVPEDGSQDWSEIRDDLAAFARANRGRFDEIEAAILEVKNGLSKLGRHGDVLDTVRAQIDKTADQRIRDLRDETTKLIGRVSTDVKSVFEEVTGFKSAIELNVERKLLDFEVSMDAKVCAALEGHLTEARTAAEAADVRLLERLEEALQRHLTLALDRFKDYYSTRLADLEARSEQRADRVSGRLQDVQQLLLRVVSRVEQVTGQDRTSEGLQRLGEQQSLFGEALRELVDVMQLAITPPSEDAGALEECSVENDGDDALELDVDSATLHNGVSTAVRSSFEKMVTGEIGRRLDEIRGRLD